jgi:hypothetical protein
LQPGVNDGSLGKLNGPGTVENKKQGDSSSDFRYEIDSKSDMFPAFIFGMDRAIAFVCRSG